MALTPNDILKISAPVEAIYQRTVDDLLINIARHFEISGWERTRYWEIKKLSEMGALTKESAAIIAKNTQMLPDEIEKAFLQVSEKACLSIDPQLRAAAAKGLLQDPQSTPSTSVLMRQMVQGYVDQAVDKMNMTNTTMLASTQQAYVKGVTTAVNTAMLEEAKLAVETGALSVVTGVETRTRAIRKAMNAIEQTGITGFVDKANRHWSAEAYAAMVVRTTSHNASISAIKTRQQEYGGGDIFQVSSHPAARELCYPYQGLFFSWSGSGTFTDGAGDEHEYDDINNTSYGEPAGLFGINCGHEPIPMIPNFSYPQNGPVMDEEENKKAYEESQKQRAYEREIREAKRDVEIAKATGDTDAVKAAKDKVAQKQANMRAYLKETGQPRRYDREAIAGQGLPEGYKGYRAQFFSDLTSSTKSMTAEGQVVVDGLKASGIKYNKVSERTHDMTEAEIIQTLAGGDQTQGSCVSVGLSYVGQVNGLDVEDYRGGKSQEWFSRKYHVKQILDLPDINLMTETARAELTAGNNLLKRVEEGEQYYFVCGKHAAVVRKEGGVLQYLELQSNIANGWKNFDGNARYTLSHRFGARQGRGIDEEAYMFNVKDAQGSEDLKEILGYINTAAGDQKKGAGGFAK